MKKAILLGASGVLGGAIAKTLTNKGFQVLGTKYQQEPKDLEENPNVDLVKMDINDPKSVEEFLEIAKSRGEIDFFTSTVSNKPKINKFENIPLKTFEEDIKTNVLTHIKIIKNLLPLLKENSNIIFILSEQVSLPKTQYTSSYSLCKHALLGLMKSLSEELKRKKIRVNAVSPGMMDTPFIKDFPSFVKESYKLKTKNKSLVKPERVAKKIGEIIENQNINGQNIGVFD